MEILSENIARACAAGDLVSVQNIIQNNDNINLNYPFGSLFESPFIHACKRNRRDIIDYLLTCDININFRNSIGDTALYFLLINRNEELLKILLNRRGINLTLSENTHGGSTVLHYCFENGMEDLANYILDNNIQTINDKNVQGQSILQYMCTKKHLNWDLIKKIRNYKYIDVNSKANDGTTVFHNACERGDVELFKYFYEDKAVYRHEKDNKNVTPFMLACTYQRIEIVEIFLEDEDLDLEEKDCDGNIALYGACKSAHFDMDLLRLIIFDERQGLESAEKVLENTSLNDDLAVEFAFLLATKGSSGEKLFANNEKRREKLKTRISAARTKSGRK